MQEFTDPMRRELEGFSVDEIVTLFEVDAGAIGGDVYRFSPSPVLNDSGGQVQPSYAGRPYAVIPFESEGWEFSAGGPMPQPTVRFLTARGDGDQTSIASFLMSLVERFDDLLGAQVRRIQTLRKFLDDGATPDPQANMGVEIYTIARKTNQTPDMIEFQLQAALDLEDVVLPRRQVLNFCQLAYRRANASGGFDYSGVTCPYTGAEMFDADGNRVTTAPADRCGRGLGDCKLRFGANAVLPFGGFPGAGKLKV